MSHFPDTSFLCALYRTQDNSPLADRWMKAHLGPLMVSSLVLLEFHQSVRLQIRLNENDLTKGFGRLEGEQMLRDLQGDLGGAIIAVVPVDWADVHHVAEGRSGKHTLQSGNRLGDILHAATALHLGVREFLTFNAYQKKMAEAEGLLVTV